MMEMTTRTKAMLGATGTAAAVVVALTIYAATSGGDSTTPAKNPGSSATSSAQPVPTYSVPSDWTEPDRWLALPRGKSTTADGYQTGFPDTQDGAVAMMVAASSMNVQGSESTVDAQMEMLKTYMTPADQSPTAQQKVKQQAGQADADLRSTLGLPATGPLPSGAFQRTTAVAFKIIQASSQEVTVYVETRVAQKAGETQPEKDSYVTGVLGAVWQGGDWKLSSKASDDALQQTQGQDGPAVAAPGDARFNDAGWTAIRQATASRR